MVNNEREHIIICYRIGNSHVSRARDGVLRKLLFPLFSVCAPLKRPIIVGDLVVPNRIYDSTVVQLTNEGLLRQRAT